MNLPEKLQLPVGHIKNRIHQPDSKIHYSQGTGHNFLCTLKVQIPHFEFKYQLI